MPETRSAHRRPGDAAEAPLTPRLGLRRTRTFRPTRPGARANRDPLAALVLAVAGLASMAALAGLLSGGGEGALTYTTARGEVVETYGRGLYAADALFTGAGFRGTDAVTLLVALPLLGWALRLRRREPLRGSLLLAGALTYFAYVYASLALGAAYNDLLILHVAVLAGSLVALGAVLSRIDSSALAGPARRLPRRRVGAFLLASGGVTAALWLSDVLAALASGETPQLRGYTTLVTLVLDVGVIVPAVVTAGVLVLRASAAGIRLAVPLLVLEALLLPLIVGQTASQLEAGVAFTPAEIAGPMVSFVVLAGLATLVLRVVMRALAEPAHSSRA